jgi:hypothetical protein
MIHRLGIPTTNADGVSSRQGQAIGASASGDELAGRTITGPFDRIILKLDRGLLSDDILPAGALLECVSVDVLNGYINYVDLAVVITERDPEEDERYISISNQFYTHFHEFGTVIHVIGSSPKHWWYFCYDIDANDCTIGRAGKERITLAAFREWVEAKRLTRRYPSLEINTGDLRGWRSFQ